MSIELGMIVCFTLHQTHHITFSRAILIRLFGFRYLYDYAVDETVRAQYVILCLPCSIHTLLVTVR